MSPVLYFILAVIILFAILKIVSAPFKLIIKLIINSVIGGILIYLVNMFGAPLGITIGLNFFTSIFVGFTGIPGVIILIILNKFIL